MTEQELTPASNPTSPRRVVVAEDESLIRLDIVEILRDNGFDVVGEAGDGETAVQLATELRPDLVITDIMMPHVDGFQVIETLHNDESLRDIPIIVLTAKELTAQERERLSGQIAALLQKGSSMDEKLLQSILAALN